jgi:hypothetical protein
MPMASQNKDKQYYELTREKPYGLFYMVLVGGTACSVLGFLIVSLVGTYEGLPLDSIILAFLAAVLLGFILGGLMTWLAVKYIGPVIDKFDSEKSAPPIETSVPESVQAIETPEETPDADKGQTVDFVFPEITPDQQS